MTGNFIVYLIGYVIAIVGVGYGLSAAGLGDQWIIAVVLVMIGLGIVYALSRSQRDKAIHHRQQQPPRSETRETIIQRDVPTAAPASAAREEPQPSRQEPPPPHEEPRH